MANRFDRCVACLSADQGAEALTLTERCLALDPRNIAALSYRTTALAMAGRMKAQGVYTILLPNGLAETLAPD